MRAATVQLAGILLLASTLAAQGGRIVTLEGFGDYFIQVNGERRLVKPDGLGVNIVAVVQRVEGERIWIKANGGGDEPAGWVDRKDAIPLDEAIAYFTARIERHPADWDAYLRLAEAEHALNQREKAIADYTRAIALRGDEAFLFLRRGREYRIVKACREAVADFAQASKLRAGWAEPYNQSAGKAIGLIGQAIALDDNPTYLTVLAAAYYRSGELEKAAATQRRAIESAKSPPGYREGALLQLREYEAAIKKH
jgi:tetratricopeptide (TPR) repeat protein